MEDPVRPLSHSIPTVPEVYTEPGIVNELFLPSTLTMLVKDRVTCPSRLGTLYELIPNLPFLPLSFRTCLKRDKIQKKGGGKVLGLGRDD